MALIECPQCRHKISEKAHRCPKCGYIQKPSGRPNSVTETTSYGYTNTTLTDALQDEQESSKMSYYWLWLVLGGLIIILVVLWLFSSKNTSSTQVGITEETPIERTTEEERVLTEEVMLNDTTCIIEDAEAEEVVAADFVGESSHQGTYTLTGKVNDKYAIQIWITIYGNELKGKYCYISTLEKYGDQPSSYIQIQGYITSSDEFKFTSTYVNSTKTSEWEGDFNGNCFYAKNWGKDEVMIAYVDD